MTDGEPKAVVSASLQKIKTIKNPIKFFFLFFNFIKSETSDSFVSHFDGHFAYLKTLNFYFKVQYHQQNNWCPNALNGRGEIPFHEGVCLPWGRGVIIIYILVMVIWFGVKEGNNGFTLDLTSHIALEVTL